MGLEPQFAITLGDLILVQFNVTTTWSRATFPACDIVGRVKSPTIGASVVFSLLRIPFFVANFLDALLGFP